MATRVIPFPGSKRTAPSSGRSIGDFLIRRLRQYGVNHVFGIPGDYVLGFYDLLERSPIDVIGTCKEDAAGFAADAYARINGLGACCVTYCVGGLSITNAIAGAYAEKSPVVVLTGSPGLRERTHDPMLHHKVKDFNTQRDIFSHITAAAVVIDDPETAFRTIDETLATCMRTKRPVYIELPRDMVDVVPQSSYRSGSMPLLDDPAALDEAVAEIVRLVNAAKNPVILAGVEVHRHGMQPALLQLVERTGIPVAVTLLGKSVISERHPRYLGVYEGAMGRSDVADVVENSDCLLALGTFMTDVNLGVFTANLQRERSIQVNGEAIQVHHHRYVNMRFENVMKALANAPIGHRNIPLPEADDIPLLQPTDDPIHTEQLFRRLNALLEDDMAVVCDVGLCLFAAIDLVIHKRTEFIAPAYYTSMGFGVPAGLGVALANDKLRPIILVGDGAFQMTGMELSSIARQGLAPIVIVLNNRGYTTERAIKDGPYNDILEWNYDALPQLLGTGSAFDIRSEREFVAAWHEAVEDTESFTLLNVHLDPNDHCPALKRLGERLAANLE